MTHDIMASALDTNNKTVTVENIRVADGTFVESNTELCTISTPKASEVILSSCSGFVVILAREGEELPVGKIVISIYDTREEADLGIANKKQRIEKNHSDIKATSKAKRLAQEYGIDLSLVKKDTIIKEKDVQEFINERNK